MLSLRMVGTLCLGWRFELLSIFDLGKRTHRGVPNWVVVVAVEVEWVALRCEL